MEKKNVAIIILAIALIGSGVGNILFAANMGLIQILPPDVESFVIFGTQEGPEHLEPQYAWDSASIDVLDQIAEGLYRFDTKLPSLPVTPQLAADLPVVTEGGTLLTIALRTGITFHDGSEFNATVVKWVFDRLNHFLNYSGNSYLPAPFNVPVSPTEGITNVASLYLLPDGRPVINNTVVNSRYSVTLNLNAAKASFISMLCFSGSYMISMESTPALRYIDLNETCIGTGPFIQGFYIPDVQLSMTANTAYWQGAPEIDRAIFLIILDANTRNQALLSGDINLLTDPLPSLLSTFEAEPSIHLERGGGTLITQYMGMNVNRLNQSMRKAISYAINYSYIIDVILEDQGVRLESPIPQGIPMSNYSAGQEAYYDLTIARQTLIDNNFGGVCGAKSATNDADWTTPFVTYNYSTNLGNQIRLDIGQYIQNALTFIGVNVVLEDMSWGELLDRGEEVAPYTRDMLELYYIGWGPDYIDPENFITPLFSNQSTSDFSDVNDPYLENLMALGETTVDQVARQAIYNEIQRYIVEELYPWVFVYTGKNNDAYATYLKGFVTNSMGQTYFYDCYWG
jgi:peptide/nickel transport system substrate-binding protein